MKSADDIVITGLGMVSPIGVGIDDFTEALVQGQSGIKERELFADTQWPFRIGGIVDNFEPKKYVKPRKSLKLMCREIQFGFGASQLAIEDAQIDFEQVDSTRVGIICGTDTFYCDPSSIADSYWSGESTIQELSPWIERAMKSIEPLWMLKYLPNMIASHIAIAINAQGPNNSIIQGDASGLLALVEAADVIRRGWADVMVTGGTGSKINPTYLAYHGISHLAQPADDLTQTCRPFDQDRQGSVGGEGAGMVILERRSHAEKRNARIYGKLSSFDYGYAKPEQETLFKMLAHRIERVIQKSGVSKDQISHVNSYASGEMENDQVNAAGIRETLGDVPVTAYQGHYGNLGPADGMIGSCASLKSFQTKVVAPTINCQSQDEACPVNVVTEPLQEKQTAAIQLAASNTGQQIAVLYESEFDH